MTDRERAIEELANKDPLQQILATLWLLKNSIPAFEHQHEWSNWLYHHNGGEKGFENWHRECRCGVTQKTYDTPYA